MDVRRRRHLDNTMHPAPPVPGAGQLLSREVRSELEAERDAIVQEVLHTRPAEGETDPDVYLGAAGLALMFLSLSASRPDGAARGRLRAHAAAYLGRALVRLEAAPKASRVPSFLLGAPGPLALAVVPELLDPSRRGTGAGVRGLLQTARVASSDELLYGRAGYLYAALLANRLAGRAVVPRAELDDLGRIMVASGRSGARAGLSFRWHGEAHLGAAHGLAGILHVLFELPQVVKEAEAELRTAVEQLLAERLPSGNLPPAAEAPSDDSLVQWCHGATGLVMVLVRAAAALNAPEYLEAAAAAAEVVWQRGLLTKGLGLCHGVAGNGYAFLTLHRATDDPRWHHAALSFARFMLTEEGRALHDVPDRPHSLFEGLAGAAVYLDHVLHPAISWFPGLELPPATHGV